MKVGVQLSGSELRAVISMLEDQLFRIRFIDRKLPGYKLDAECFQAAESALEQLRAAATARPMGAEQQTRRGAERPPLPNSRRVRGPSMTVVSGPKS